jgi:hypothetical protein
MAAKVRFVPRGVRFELPKSEYEHMYITMANKSSAKMGQGVVEGVRWADDSGSAKPHAAD